MLLTRRSVEMRITARTIVAALLAPAFAGVLTYLADSLISGYPRSGTYFVAYFVFCYLFALVPAFFIVIALKKAGFTDLWHFAFGGIATGTIGAIAFLLYTYEPSLFWSELLEVSPLVGIGGVAGICTWVAGELQWK